MISIARDVLREPLYVVVPYFNPWRHKSRVKHTERALKHFHDSGAVIVLVEISFNRRELVFANSGLDGTIADCGILDGKFRHKYIGLHSKEELWLKENAINIGVQSLPFDWQQVAWIDSDVHFARPNWVGECAHKLQHYAFLQMFSQAMDLAPNYEVLPDGYSHARGESFVQAWKQGRIRSTLTPQIRADLVAIASDLKQLEHDFVKLHEDLAGNCYELIGGKNVFHGLAWACTRQAWESVGGLIDFAIWGGADFHMNQALIERTDDMMLPTLHRNYKKLVNQWYHRCRTDIRKNVGVMDGVIFHHWHGKKTKRGYGTKHKLLAQFGFDPPRHLKRDHQGLYQLHDDGTITYTQMRDMMRKIAHERDEDSIDV